MSDSARVLAFAFLVGRKEFASFWSVPTWVGGWMVRIVAQAAFFTMLGQLLGSQARMEFLLIGNAVVMGALSANWAVAASTWDRGDGTYALLVASPSSVLPAIVGRTAVWMLNGVASSLLTFAVLGLAFGVALPLQGSLLSVPILISTTVASFCMAMFLGALATKAPGFRNVIHNVQTATLMLFSGVSVPHVFWPEPVQALAHLLPVTNGLNAIRGLLAGADLTQVAPSAVAEIVVAAGWLALAALTFDRFAEQGRSSGSIEYA